MSPTAVSEPNAPSTVEQLKAQLNDTSISTADLRAFENFDSTWHIGTEFPAYSPDGKPVLTIRDVLADEAKLKALGRLVSERGVVFFRNADITPEEQITLVDSLGKHGGKPASSSLHIHPLTFKDSKYGDEISLISNKVVFHDNFKRPDAWETAKATRRPGKHGWHSDITFENVPSDYASLVIRELPPVGGDTLWASAYEAYDRLTPAFQKFLEGLTAVHKGTVFLQLANGKEVREHRGSPENVGQDLETVHPVIRTNPVTGWKGLFVNRGFTKKIVELSQTESDKLLEDLFDIISDNHDLQVRFRWEKNSLAIWDNRSTFHTATSDVPEGALREGTRSVSIGERPYFDPKSSSRREALRAQAAQ